MRFILFLILVAGAPVGASIPPVQHYEESDAYTVFGEVRPDIFRWQIPNEDLDQWAPATLSTVESSLILESDLPMPTRRGWLAIPTPLFYELKHLELKAGTRALTSESQYVVQRSKVSGAYAIRILDPSIDDLWVRADFADRSPGRSVRPVEISGKGWRRIANDLERMGETSLSEALSTFGRAGAGAVNRLVKNYTTYTFHPVTMRPSGPGPFGALTPLLNDDGELCLQCIHAAQMLFEPMLRAAYAEYPEYSFRSVKVLMRRSFKLKYPVHWVVEVRLAGKTLMYLNPTPWRDDTRGAPAEDAKCEAHLRVLEDESVPL